MDYSESIGHISRFYVAFVVQFIANLVFSTAVRYSAANPHLDCIKGQFRLLHNVRPGGEKAMAATLTAIDKFATPRLDALHFGATKLKHKYGQSETIIPASDPKQYFYKN